MTTTTIASITALPNGPFNGTQYVGIVITPGIPSYFQLTGANLDQIVSVNWYPNNPKSVVFETRQVILVNETLGTFMIRVLDNQYNPCDRGGNLSFRLSDSTNLIFPVKTFGPVSAGPLWQYPDAGLQTG